MPPAESMADQPVRDRIIDTATRLFYYRGIPATGVDTISRSAHVAKMSLYRHFRSKDQLILECLRRLDTRYHNWFVEQVQQRTDNPAQALLSVFDVLDEWFNSPYFRGCAFINATVELADPAHPAHGPVLAHKRRNREYLAELARRAGLGDVEAFSRQLMLLVEGSIITALVQRDFDAAKDAKRVARALLEAACVDRS